MKLKVGDNVRVITGTNKGKEGKVLKVFRKDNRVLVDGVNVVKKHMKPSRTNETGGILEVEAPIHASNVMIIDPKTKKRTRIGHTIEKDKKVRVAKKSGEKID